MLSKWVKPELKSNGVINMIRNVFANNVSSIINLPIISNVKIKNELRPAGLYRYMTGTRMLYHMTTNT